MERKTVRERECQWERMERETLHEKQGEWQRVELETVRERVSGSGWSGRQ